MFHVQNKRLPLTTKNFYCQPVSMPNSISEGGAVGKRLINSLLFTVYQRKKYNNSEYTKQSIIRYELCNFKKLDYVYVQEL